MERKSITKSVVWQLLGKFLLQGIAFFTTPIFTRILTPSDYGYTALYLSWVSIFGLLVGFQVQGSIGNARLKYNDEEIQKYLSSIMTISVLSFLFFFIISFVFSNKLSGLLGLRKDLVILVFVQSFFTFVINFEIARLDQYKEVEKSMILSLTQTIFIIVLSLIFVLKFKNKAIAKIYGQAIPIIVYGIVILILIYVRGKKIWVVSYNKFCLKLTLPLILHGIGHVLFTQSDRIMIQKIVGEKELGVYSVVYSLCSVLIIIYSALNTSWIPFYYDFKKNNNRDEILKHTKRYIFFFLVLCLGFSLLSYDVYKLMAPKEYYEGMKAIPLFILSIWFSFLYLFPVNYEFYHCQTKLIPIGTLLAAIINFIINYLLISKYSIFGAAVGTVIAHCLLFFFHWIIANKIKCDKFDYSIKYFLISTIILIVSLVLIVFLQNLIFVRWCLAIMLGIYLVIDVLKNRSFF